jgi:hypothetical protein
VNLVDNEVMCHLMQNSVDQMVYFRFVKTKDLHVLKHLYMFMK